MVKGNTDRWRVPKGSTEKGNNQGGTKGKHLNSEAQSKEAIKHGIRGRNEQTSELKEGTRWQRSLKQEGEIPGRDAVPDFQAFEKRLGSGELEGGSAGLPVSALGFGGERQWSQDAVHGGQSREKSSKINANVDSWQAISQGHNKHLLTAGLRWSVCAHRELGSSKQT